MEDKQPKSDRRNLLEKYDSSSVHDVVQDALNENLEDQAA